MLALAQLALLVMPWNLALWWQIRRLRVAVELDCDARVLRSGDVRFYGDLLLDVARPRQARLIGVTAFAERAVEVLAAVAENGRGPVARARDLRPFLRRPGNRDCARVLEKLERWFLRQYDVRHGAVVLHHAARLAQGRSDPDRVLSWHSRAARGTPRGRGQSRLSNSTARRRSRSARTSGPTCCPVNSRRVRRASPCSSRSRTTAGR